MIDNRFDFGYDIDPTLIRIFNLQNLIYGESKGLDDFKLYPDSLIRVDGVKSIEYSNAFAPPLKNLSLSTPSDHFSNEEYIINLRSDYRPVSLITHFATSFSGYYFYEAIEPTLLMEQVKKGGSYGVRLDIEIDKALLRPDPDPYLVRWADNVTRAMEVRKARQTVETVDPEPETPAEAETVEGGKKKRGRKRSDPNDPRYKNEMEKYKEYIDKGEKRDDYWNKYVKDKADFIKGTDMMDTSKNEFIKFLSRNSKRSNANS